MPKTLELEDKMQKAIEFNFNFYKENRRFPKTNEDPYYRSAIRYFKGARNYRRQVLVSNGLTEEQAEIELNRKSISKEELFEDALTLYKEKGILWYGSDLVDEYFGCLFYIRKAVLEEMGFSKGDLLYEIKAQIMKSSLPLEDVIEPLESYIKEVGEIPKSYDLTERGNIVKRFEKWDIAVEVALEHLENPDRSVEEIFAEKRDPYLPNVETLRPIIEFIEENKRLPKSVDIRDYRKITREYILWDNALDEAMEELGYDETKRIEMFRER